MDKAAQIIEKELKPILPLHPHYLSSSPTQRYTVLPPDSTQLEEQAIRQLQYTTFVSDTDRVLLTRAYFDVRLEHSEANNVPKPSRPDPNKARTKLSLKDYARRKEAPDTAPSPKPRAVPNPSVEGRDKETALAPAKPAGASVANDMERSRDTKKGAEQSNYDAQRRRSPSPERKRRVIEADDDAARSAKRVKGSDVTSSSAVSRPAKSALGLSHKLGLDKKTSKDPKPVATNGSASINRSDARGASPRPGPPANGTHKRGPSKDHTPRKSDHNSSKSDTPAIPPLLSPLRLGLSEPSTSARPSPKKKPAESALPKSLPKKPQIDREPSPTAKKRKPLQIPPLLSPTLPPIVMEELARMDRLENQKTKLTPPYEPPSQKSSRAPTSPIPSSQKTVPKPSQESTITVDSRPERKKETKIITMKYKKRVAKRVESLLKLPPKGRKKQDGLKREEGPTRERSDSVEPAGTVTARKRPRTATDANSSEAYKRPRTSEALQPSTPMKQSSAMTRVTSSSSIAGTPGAGSNLTPATQPDTETRRADPEKAHRQMSRANTFKTLGTKLKHERDGIMRPKEMEKAKMPERDRHEAIASGIQSLLSYIYAFKIEMDVRDMDKKSRQVAIWRDMGPLFRAIRSDCSMYANFSALILRIQGMCLGYHSKALCSYPDQPEAAKELMRVIKEQQDVWKASEKARKSLGVFDGNSNSEDGGSVGKLIDRLGPWSTVEEAIPVTISVLRKIVRLNDRWRPAEELAKVTPTTTNGNT